MDIWKAGEEVYDIMRNLITQYHPHLALVEKEIVILFRDKASKSGGVTTMGKSSKTPDWVSELDTSNWKFKIELASDEWKGLPPELRTALMDHHLCAMGVEEKKDGSLKHFIKPPDLIAYQAEIERHGVWRIAGEESEPSVIEQLFARKT